MPSINCQPETKQTFTHIQNEYHPDCTHDEILTIIMTHYIDRHESGIIGRIESLEEFRDLLGMLDGMRSDLEYIRLQAEKYESVYREEHDE